MNVPREPQQVLVVVLTIAIAITGVWAASTSVPAFGVYNPGWEGASELRGEATAANATPVVATRVTEYDDVSPNRTVAVVLSPDRPYSDREAARLRQFVQEGGMLVIAEDFGPHTNSLLLRVGASTRVDGRLVRDEESFYRSPNLTVATGVSDSTLTEGVGQVTLNHGTVLEPYGARVLVETSPFAYVDENRNMSLDRDESMQTYPVVTAEEIGNGRVVTISDPSVFINAMIERPGNERFAQALFAERSTVLLDYSHTASVPPLALALMLLRASPAMQGLVGLGLVGLVVLVSAQLPAVDAYRRNPEEMVPPPSRAEVRQRVARRHPEWDEERIDRVIEGIITNQEETQKDD